MIFKENTINGASDRKPYQGSRQASSMHKLDLLVPPNATGPRYYAECMSIAVLIDLP